MKDQLGMQYKDKAKLLIVTDFFYPHWTGISKSIYNLTKALENEYQILVLTVQYEKRLKKIENIFSAYVIREPFLFSFSRSKYSISIILKFCSMVSDYDVILVNSPSANILFFSTFAKMFRKKLFIFHQGDLVLPDGFINRVIENIFDISSLISFSLADKISTYTRDYGNNSRIMKYFLNKFYPVMLPIYTDEKAEENSNLKKLKKLKSQGKIIFGFAGRFVEEKGFDILFDAIPKVIEKIPNAYFAFAGETNISYEDFFDKNIHRYQKIRNRLTLLGLLREKEMITFYSCIDFIVIPSRSDCFNLVQAEAMLSGIPSIVSNIPGARYLVRKTGFGLIFRKGDSKDLARCIITAFEKQHEFRPLQQNVKNILDNKKNVKRIKEFIKS